MSLSSSTVWEVRTTGSDTNGGGFRAGSSGTDYSQQGAPQLIVTDAAATGTKSLTSAVGGFTAAMVGNLVQLSGGSLTAGFYEITAFTNANTVTLDRSAGNGSGATARVGGALATLTKAIEGMVGGNVVWIRSGTYTVSNTSLTPPGWAMPDPLIINGYSANRGDLEGAVDYSNHPIIQKGAGTEPLFTLVGTAQRLRCLTLDGNGLAASAVTASGASNIGIEFCWAKNCTGVGFATNGTYSRCLSSGNAGGGFIASGANNYNGCVAASNAGPGFVAAGATSFLRCVSFGNSGELSHGFHASGPSGPVILNCVAHGNGGDGVRFSSLSGVHSGFVRNCILTGNGGFGLNSTAGAPSLWSATNYNAFFSNGAGARNNAPVGGNDVMLTADPFVNSAAGDFDLIAGGAGGQCRATGYPGALAGGLTVGATDIGVAQHADPTTSGQARVFGSGVILGKGVS